MALADHLKDLIQRKCNFTDRVYDPAAQILSERAGRGIWSTLKSMGSRVFYSLPFCRPSPPLQVSEKPDKPTRPTERVVGVAKMPRFDPYWAGAKLLSALPVQIETAGSAWGFSALFPIAQHRRRRGDKGPVWVEARVRTISGCAGIGLLLEDDTLVEERVVSIEDGLCTLFFPMPAADVRGVVIRSAGIPSSVLEVVDLALLAERPTG